MKDYRIKKDIRLTTLNLLANDFLVFSLYFLTLADLAATLLLTILKFLC